MRIMIPRNPPVGGITGESLAEAGAVATVSIADAGVPLGELPMISDDIRIGEVAQLPPWEEIKKAWGF